jgi:putative peptide zinc metalloprotease protein
MDQIASEFVQSTRRPVPLHRRPGLVVQRVHYEGRPFVVVKDPLSLRYFRLQPEQFCLLELLDGCRSLEDLRSALQAGFPVFRPTLHEIAQSIAELHQLELAYSSRPGQSEPLVAEAERSGRSRILRALANPLFVRLPGLDLDRFLGWLQARIGWVFHPIAVTGVALMVGVSLIMLLLRVDRFQRSLPTAQQFFSAGNLLQLWLSVGILKVIHELGHGTCSKHFGRECHETGVAFLVFSPCLYCDVSDSWLLPEKWKRIAVSAAGMYFEIVLAAVALILWCVMNPGWVHYLCLNVFLVGGIGTLLFNANPLLRYDGYYILADLVEVPNLRPKADAVLGRSFARWLLGIEMPPNSFLPQNRRFLYGFFSLASTTYCWMLAFGILIVFYRFSKSIGLEQATVPVAAAVVGAIPLRVASDARRRLHALWAGRKRPLRIVFSFAGLVALGAAACWIPVPWPVTGEIRVEPRHAHHIYVTSPGILGRLLAHPGSRVKKGQVLAQLENPQAERQLQESLTSRELLEVEIKVDAIRGDVAAEKTARQSLTSADKEIAALRNQIAELTIRAPCDGRLISPPAVRAQSAGERFSASGRWVGTPLDRRNLGCSLSVGDHLCDLAPDESNDAILSFQQADRSDFSVGAAVSLYVDQQPSETYPGVVVDVEELRGSVAHSPGRTESVFREGTLPAAGDPNAASTTYHARVASDELPPVLAAGGSGFARRITYSRSAAGLMWRAVRQTFSFGQ